MSEPRSSAVPPRHYDVPPGVAVAYHYRGDPQWMSPERIAAAARDRPVPPPPGPAKPPREPWVPKREKFDAARAAGLSFAGAQGAAGCSLRSAKRFERDRLRREAPGT